MFEKRYKTLLEHASKTLTHKKTIDLKLGLGVKLTIAYEKRNVNTISYGNCCMIYNEIWKENSQCITKN